MRVPWQVGEDRRHRATVAAGRHNAAAAPAAITYFINLPEGGHLAVLGDPDAFGPPRAIMRVAVEPAPCSFVGVQNWGNLGRLDRRDSEESTAYARNPSPSLSAHNPTLELGVRNSSATGYNSAAGSDSVPGVGGARDG